MTALVAIIVLSALPFLWLGTQSAVLGSPLAVFANIAGFVGAVLMLWQYILGIRGIARVFFGNLAVPLKLHQLLGVYGMFFILIHPVSEMLSYGENMLFLVRPDLSDAAGFHITLGRISVFLLLFVFVTSALVREKLSRKVWLTIHYSSYATMLFVFFHGLDAGTFLRTFPLIRAYWFLMIAVYVCILIWRIAIHFGIGSGMQGTPRVGDKPISGNP